MKISTTLEISLPEGRISITQLEKLILKALWQAGKELLLRSFRVMEEKLLQEEEVVIQSKRRKWLLTRFGRLRVERYKVRFKREARYGFLLDEALGLFPAQEPTPWVRKMACELALAYPFRQAASLLSHLLNERIDHRALWRWIQKEGSSLREDQEERKRKIFEEGKAPPKGKAREIIVVEVDGTAIPSQEKGSLWMEAKLGVMYTGKELTSPTAKHKRYRLKEKTLYGSLEEVDQFAQGLVTQAEEKLSLSQARHVLLVGDGQPWIKGLLAAWLPGATYQVDHFHLQRHIYQICHGDHRLAKEMLKRTFSLELARLALLLHEGQLLGKFSPEEAQGLLGYLEANQEGIWGSLSLKDKVESQEVLVRGSGAIEKNIDTVIARRFKGQGMRWSRKGASHLLALRIAFQHPATWKGWWEKQAA